VAIGNNGVRQDITAQLLQNGFQIATVIHPRSCVCPSAEVGAGSAIMAGAIVGTLARLGQGVVVNCGAVVDHDAVVEDFGHLGVNASMAGGTILGQGAWMQAGSVLGYGVIIPAGATLQPGEAVVKAA
jgi:UDP-3-O-[3-hydroxymyristoyl] glucosamine N-acyltransferase